MKKFLSTLLGFVLLFSLTVPAIASGIIGSTEGDVTASFNPDIAITGVSVVGDTVTYDAATKTYTVMIPIGAELVSYTKVIEGANLTYIPESDETYFIKEVVGTQENSKPIGADIDQAYDEGTGTLRIEGAVSSEDANTSSKYAFSNDGGETWSDPVTIVIKQAHAITVNTTANGTVTVGGNKTSAVEGETVELFVNAAEGYALDTLTVTDAHGADVPVSANHTFTMPASDVTVSATFKVSVITYTVTINPVENGTVSANKSGTHAGDNVTLTISPGNGYRLHSLTITDSSNGSVPYTDSYSFVMPASNVTITATFQAVYAITTEINGDGTIQTPAIAAEGESVTVTLNPADGYTPTNFKVFSGAEPIAHNQVNDTTYSFRMPNKAVVMSVDFFLPGTTLETIYYKGSWTNVLFEFFNSAGTQTGTATGTMAEAGVYAVTGIPDWTTVIIFRNTDNAEEFIRQTIPTNDQNMYDAVNSAWSTYAPSQPPEDTVSAEITWGSMSFTYDDTIAEGAIAENGWTNDGSDGAATITVKNTGDTGITVSVSYIPEGTYSGINGTFDSDSADLETAVSQTFTLTLSGKPKKVIPAGTKIGQVTITITASPNQDNDPQLTGITTPEALAEAIAAGGDIKLGGDMTIETLSISNSVNIDLGGHTLTTELTIKSGAALHLSGGTIRGSNTTAVRNDGGTVHIEDCILIAPRNAFYHTQGTSTLQNCEIHGYVEVASIQQTDVIMLKPIVWRSGTGSTDYTGMHVYWQASVLCDFDPAGHTNGTVTQNLTDGTWTVTAVS